MSTYEVISSLFAFVAIVISLVSLVRTRRLARAQVELHKNQVELQTDQAALARLQRGILEAELIQKNSADVRVHIANTTHGHSFIVRNVGAVDARDVTVDIVSRKNGRSPIVGNEASSKLPIKRLMPDHELNLVGALSFDTGTSFDVTTTWKDPNGETRTSRFDVSI